MRRISDTDLKYILDNTEKIWRDNFTAGSRILLTGATGFFGKWLLESLVFINKNLQTDLQVIALSRDPCKFIEKYPHFGEERCIRWLQGDVKSFDYQADDLDYIIHAATDADARMINDEPLAMLDTITLGTRKVLEISLRQKQLKSILLMSSGAVYGRQPENIGFIKENDGFYLDISSIKSAYAEGKRISELYGSICSEKFGVPVKIARCFAFVGPYLPLDKHYAIGNFIRDGLEGRDITITGDGSPLRSYMYASDLIIWLFAILFKGNRGEAYNVGSDFPVSIKDLAEKVAGFFPGIKVNLLYQVRATDRNQNYVPDVSKARARFDFGKGVTLEEAISKTIKFLK
jgi:nucleoside-diphosphate-sugar epimerase